MAEKAVRLDLVGQVLEVCAECHFVDKGDHGSSQEGGPAFQDLADDPATTATGLRVSLQKPRTLDDAMPNLILTNTETDDIIAYILSLK